MCGLLLILNNFLVPGDMLLFNSLPFSEMILKERFDSSKKLKTFRRSDEFEKVA